MEGSDVSGTIELIGGSAIFIIVFIIIISLFQMIEL